MQKLTIEINSKNGEFINSLEYIKDKIENWFFSWNDENLDENYNFKIT